jgi:hypothetical protein
MKRIVLAALLLAGLAAAPSARAEIGTPDAVPAATLLLPYFEVDLGNTNGVDTLISVNNASASAAVANVVLWTDWGVPSLGFQIYLTGYDVQTIDLRTIFNGQLPVTADAGADPGDAVTHKGILSQDINFPGSTGPCGAPSTLYSAPDPSLATKITNLNRVHTGQSSNIDGKCWGAAHGDQIARGYVTVDTLTQCTLSTPADPAYFASGVADTRNILWGDVIYLNPGQNTAQGETLVHIEACDQGFSQYRPGISAGGGGACPFTNSDYTFYGRYATLAGKDSREPLATTFAARYQGASKTDLLVWRDTKTTPAKVTCGATRPSWFPLADTDVVAFDTEENPTDECALASANSPAASSTCFPLATQRVNLRNGNAIAAKIKPPANAGWLFLNLNHTVSGDVFPGVAQAWVIATRTSGDGRLSNGTNAIQLDNALRPDAQLGSGVLIP